MSSGEKIRFRDFFSILLTHNPSFLERFLPFDRLIDCGVNPYFLEYTKPLGYILKLVGEVIHKTSREDTNVGQY